MSREKLWKTFIHADFTQIQHGLTRNKSIHGLTSDYTDLFYPSAFDPVCEWIILISISGSISNLSSKNFFIKSIN
jgi:hypothetical protein